MTDGGAGAAPDEHEFEGDGPTGRNEDRVEPASSDAGGMVGLQTLQDSETDTIKHSRDDDGDSF
ncbi:hypothetical protein GCM10023340_19500 [Nocardioides marinquilinus]|uniref:Uncharacterized protein n=1 Tax=Nocardioides marinquilinus TaxID=1210400 RepID=A0ABP9PIS4_9ACTN